MCEGGDVRNELDGTLNYFLTISEGFVTGFVYPPSGKKDFYRWRGVPVGGSLA